MTPGRSLFLLPFIGLLISACNDQGSSKGASSSAPSSQPPTALSAMASASSAPSASSVPAADSVATAEPVHDAGSASAAATPTPNVALPNDHEGPAIVAWRPNGRSFAVGLGDKVSIVPVSGGQPLALAGHSASVRALVFSKKGDRLATVEEGGKVRVWDPGTGKLAAELTDGPTGDVYSLAFSDDSKRLAAAGSVAAIWDVDKKKKLCSTAESWNFDLAFTRDMGSLVTTGNGNSVRWDVATCAKKADGWAKTGGTFGSWVSPDGKYVAAAEPDGHGLSLFDAWSFKGIEALAKSFGCADHIGPVRFSRDGEILLISGTYKWFRSIRLDSKKTIAAYDVPHGDEVEQIVMFDDGERILIIRGDKAELVSAPSKSVAYTLELKGARVFDISWDMKYILGSSPEAALIWEASTGKLVKTFPLPK